MKTARLTYTQRQQFEKTAKQIKLSRCFESDIYCRIGNFYYLYDNIIQKLRRNNKKTVIKLYDFVELMKNSYGFLKPEEAFTAGIQAKLAGTDCNEGLMDYFREVHKKLNGKKTSAQKQELFHELCDALGESRGLMTMFIEDFAKYSSAEIYNIDEYFKRGYEIGGEEAS